jgi:hypothetical protein
MPLPRAAPVPARRRAVGAMAPQGQRLVAQHPDEARRDRRAEHHQGGEHGIGARAAGLEPLPDRPQLHADQHEGEGIQHEHHRLPDREHGHPLASRQLGAAAACDRHGVGDQREDAREPDRLGRDPDAEGQGELHDQQHRHFAHPVISRRSA